MKTTASIENAITLLRGGGVGVLPVDTVYGLVACAHDKVAVERFYKMKNRSHKPGTVVAASVQQLVELGVPQRYLERVERWWPAALSVEIPLGKDLDYLHQETGRQAFRVVADERLRKILEQTGPLVTSSANKPGEPGAVNVEEAQAYFENQIDFYVDGGDMSGRAPSTIVRVTDEGLEVIREGAVKIHAMRSEPKPGCPFCRGNGLLKGDILHQSGSAYMIHPVDGRDQYLIISEAHVESPADLPDEWWAEVKNLLGSIMDLPQSYNISINIGEQAGQTVKHLHFWVVPRAAGKPSSGKGLARLMADADAR